MNGGTLKVESTEGRYTLRNVNGDLEMVQRPRAPGERARSTAISRRRSPAPPDAAAEFRTVNGRVDVTLPASLSADLRLKTMNGGLYTDFETTPLPARRRPASARTAASSTVRDRYASVRVGNGGPELTFETLNGDVQVRKQ